MDSRPALTSRAGARSSSSPTDEPVELSLWTQGEHSENLNHVDRIDHVGDDASSEDEPSSIPHSTSDVRNRSPSVGVALGPATMAVIPVTPTFFEVNWLACVGEI